MLPVALCQPFVKLPAKHALLGCFDKNPTEDKMPTQIFHDLTDWSIHEMI